MHLQFQLISSWVETSSSFYFIFLTFTLKREANTFLQKVHFVRFQNCKWNHTWASRGLSVIILYKQP